MRHILFVLLFVSSSVFAGASDPSGRTDGVFTECTWTNIDVSTDASQTVSAVRSALYGIYINTVLSAHTVVIEDGTSAVITLPASLAAGTNLVLPGIRMASIVVNPNDSSTGSVLFCWKAL